MSDSSASSASQRYHQHGCALPAFGHDTQADTRRSVRRATIHCASSPVAATISDSDATGAGRPNHGSAEKSPAWGPRKILWLLRRQSRAQTPCIVRRHAPVLLVRRANDVSYAEFKKRSSSSVRDRFAAQPRAFDRSPSSIPAVG
jgi:hypothetical protein